MANEKLFFLPSFPHRRASAFQHVLVFWAPAVSFSSYDSRKSNRGQFPPNNDTLTFALHYTNAELTDPYNVVVENQPICDAAHP